jgi:t-SNARE complex subunit (syntaxin)
MPPKQTAGKVMIKSDKLTQGEKKKLKNANKAKANPDKAAAKLVKNDATRARRYVFCYIVILVVLLLVVLRVARSASNAEGRRKQEREL